LLRALIDNVFPLVSEAYGSTHCCIPANQIACAILADDYGIETKPWVCKVWAHNETYRQLLAEHYPHATTPFFPPEPELVEWENQGAFIHMCTDRRYEPIEGFPAFIEHGVDADKDGFPYHVLFTCGGSLVDSTLQQFKTGDITMRNAVMKHDGSDEFKFEHPHGVRVIYQRVHGVEVPLSYDDRFAKTKAKVSEAVRHQLRWDKQIGAPVERHKPEAAN